MRVFLGFTSTWLAFASGKVNLLEEMGTYDEPKVVFAFNCSSEHVVRKDGLLPMEVSWTEGETHRYEEGIPKDSVSPETLKQFERFLRILDAAEGMGIVLWNANRRAINLLMSKDAEVFEHGTFRKVERS